MKTVVMTIFCCSSLLNVGLFIQLNDQRRYSLDLRGSPVQFEDEVPDGDSLEMNFQAGDTAFVIANPANKNNSIVVVFPEDRKETVSWQVTIDGRIASSGIGLDRGWR